MKGKLVFECGATSEGVNSPPVSWYRDKNGRFRLTVLDSSRPDRGRVKDGGALRDCLNACPCSIRAKRDTMEYHPTVDGPSEVLVSCWCRWVPFEGE